MHLYLNIFYTDKQAYRKKKSDPAFLLPVNHPYCLRFNVKTVISKTEQSNKKDHLNGLLYILSTASQKCERLLNRYHLLCSKNLLQTDIASKILVFFFLFLYYFDAFMQFHHVILGDFSPICVVTVIKKKK